VEALSFPFASQWRNKQAGWMMAEFGWEQSINQQEASTNEVDRFGCTLTLPFCLLLAMDTMIRLVVDDDV